MWNGRKVVDFFIENIVRVGGEGVDGVFEDGVRRREKT